VVRGSDRTFPALDSEGMFRTPGAAVAFDDVALLWYMRQGHEPLVSSRGHVYDHIGLSVADLDAWVGKLREASGSGRALQFRRYTCSDDRRSSREALELVEVK
jgi:hypothetical protein